MTRSVLFVHEAGGPRAHIIILEHMLSAPCGSRFRTAQKSIARIFVNSSRNFNCDNTCKTEEPITVTQLNQQSVVRIRLTRLIFHSDFVCDQSGTRRPMSRRRIRQRSNRQSQAATQW